MKHGERPPGAVREPQHVATSDRQPARKVGDLDRAEEVRPSVADGMSAGPRQRVTRPGD